MEDRIDDITKVLKENFYEPSQKNNLGLHFSRNKGNHISIATFIATIKLYLDDDNAS